MAKRSFQTLLLSAFFLAASTLYSFAEVSHSYLLHTQQLSAELSPAYHLHKTPFGAEVPSSYRLHPPQLSAAAFHLPLLALENDLPTEGAAEPLYGDNPLRAVTLLPGEVTASPVILAEAAAAERETSKRWRWRRAGVAEYVAVSLAAVGTAIFESQNREPDEAKWKETNGFDETMRDIFRLESRTARDATQNASEFIMGVMIAAPFLETFSTLGVRDAAWSAQWQTQMVNVESFTLTSLLSSLMQNLLTRERPFVRNCRNGEECEGYLENRSMPSGHIAFALTGAGLMCTHHEYQEIYDPETERKICNTAIGVAVVDGVLRLVSDRHYTTDVLVGAAIGYFSGFILPRWLHYNHPVRQPEEPKSATRPPVQLLAFAPELLRDGALLNCRFGF